jgi:hypothetical protein
MLTLLFFRPAGSREPTLDELASLLTGIPGITWEGQDGDDYRSGRWLDPEGTGASCLIDLGEPDLEVDSMHPPRAYAGWYPLPLVVNIPLFGPHWFCVEAVRMVESNLARDSDWRALDVEDIIREPGAEPGPFPLDRLRVTANWERQRAVRNEQVTGIPLMSRGVSVSLWRYRRESTRAAQLHDQHLYPRGLALLEKASGRARSAAIWLDATRLVAIPPVELLVLPGQPIRVVDAEEAAAGVHAGSAGMAGARLLSQLETVGPYLAQAVGRPAAQFAALDDQDWAD